jgi:hypothetical protein
MPESGVSNYHVLLEKSISMSIDHIKCPLIGDRDMVGTYADDLAVLLMRSVDCGIFLASFGTQSDPYIAEFCNKGAWDLTQMGICH